MPLNHMTSCKRCFPERGLRQKKKSTKAIVPSQTLQEMLPRKGIATLRVALTTPLSISLVARDASPKGDCDHS